MPGTILSTVMPSSLQTNNCDVGTIILSTFATIKPRLTKVSYTSLTVNGRKTANIYPVFSVDETLAKTVSLMDYLTESSQRMYLI